MIYLCEMCSDRTDGRCDNTATKIVVDGDRSIPVCDEHYDEPSRDPISALKF